MREIKDIDLLKWNERMEKSPYRVQVNSTWVNNHQLISFHTKSVNDTAVNDTRGSSQTPDPVVEWEFTFSVVESRKNEFSKILERLLIGGIANHVDIYGNATKHKKISIANVVKSKTESTHEIFNRKYIRYVYNFDGRLSAIMAYITIVEDAIEFFSNTWGYDEKGEEYCLVRFPIGTVVSKEKDKSRDFLVLDYNYVVDYKDYIINYVIVEMLTDEKSLVIKYGESEIVSEKYLSYSRNNRIDNILN